MRYVNQRKRLKFNLKSVFKNINSVIKWLLTKYNGFGYTDVDK